MSVIKPMVSVITAIYNCKHTLGRAIESILSQTYENWEFIICDDCSTDGSYEVALEYQKRYPEKFVVIRNEKNSKLAFSLNHCLQYAKGEYIARIDGDDISLPERLEKQVSFLQTHPEYDVVGTAMIPFDEHGEQVPRICKECPDKFDLLKNPCFAHATILMKKSVYDTLKGYTVLPRTKRGQDYDLWFRFFAAGFRGYNMQEALYKVHESVEDLKRRSFISRLQIVQTMWFGYRLLRYPLRHYVFLLRPVCVGLIPRRWIHWHHTYKRKHDIRISR